MTAEFRTLLAKGWTISQVLSMSRPERAAEAAEAHEQGIGPESPVRPVLADPAPEFGPGEDLAIRLAQTFSALQDVTERYRQFRLTAYVVAALTAAILGIIFL